VVAPQPRLRRWLERIGQERDFAIRPLLDSAQVRSAPSFDIDALLEEARRQLDDARLGGSTSFWDFPSSAIATILAEERGLPTPGLGGTMPFEHKYWSRCLQEQVAPEDTPRFAGVDVFDDAVLDRPPLPYPFWLKPVKSHAGHLGFGVRTESEYREAIAALRDGIRRLGDPFQNVLERVAEVPRDVAELGGAAAIAEQMLDGQQCTLEGYVHDGEIVIYGLFDIYRAEDGSTFTHYLYPSRLPESVRARMQAIATELVETVGYDHAAFNIEFFVDEEQDRTWILEVNPRISQEHSHLMEWVDGATNLQVMAEAALGREPTLRSGQGSAAVAGKFFHRRWDDAVVTSTPDEAHVDALEQRYAPCVIEVLVEPGERLSERPDQEPYSYLIAYVHLAADDEEQLHERYGHIVDELGVRFDRASAGAR
jgi:hypothetical protein